MNNQVTKLISLNINKLCTKKGQNLKITVARIGILILSGINDTK